MPVQDEIQGLPPRRFYGDEVSLVSARTFKRGDKPTIEIKCNTFIVTECSIDGVKLALNTDMFTRPIVINKVPAQKLVRIRGEINGIYVENSAGGANAVLKFIYGNDVDFDAVPATSSISIDEIGGSAITLGQKTKANSLPVVIASDQDVVASEATLAAIKDTAGIKKITDPLPAGTNNIGDVDVATEPDKNQDVTVLASAARTATIDSADQSNTKGKGLHVVIDVTAIVTAPSITVKIQGKDALSGKYYDILVSAAISTVSTTILKVYPALTAAANSIANDILPKSWRVRVEHANADSITYSVGASVIE